MQTYRIDKRNVFKSIQTTYNKKVASKIEADPIWIAFDRWCSMTSGYYHVLEG